ncbi:MAG: hypothetical protein AAF211_32305, partial [Myxococcota bacterium]
CLAGAWSHGVVRPDPLRLGVAAALGAVALMGSDERLGISALGLGVSALAPGSLGMAAGLLAVTSGFAGHVAWFARAATGPEPGQVWLAWTTGVSWPLAALVLSGPALRGRHGTAFGVGWAVVITVLAAWLSSASAAGAGLEPAALGPELRARGIAVPRHVPARHARFRPDDCVWWSTESSEGRLSGPADCPDPEPETRRFVATDGTRTLRSIAEEGPGEWRVVVDAKGAALPGDLDRWRWSWEVLRLVRDGSRYPEPTDAVRVRWVRGHPLLPDHDDAPLTDATLAAAFDDAPTRAHFVAEPDPSVTLDEWLTLCRAARARHRLVRCGVRVP